jgi:hypothetical protein
VFFYASLAIRSSDDDHVVLTPDYFHTVFLALLGTTVLSSASDDAHVFAAVVEVVRTETISVVSVALALPGLVAVAVNDELARLG